MTIWWCRGCGMEDNRMIAACKTCGSAMQVASLDWLNEDDEGDETVFELETDPTERAAIVQNLVEANIRHRWEGEAELIVADIHVDAVDQILDEILGADTAVDPDAEVSVADGDQDDHDDANDDDEEEEDDDDDYKVISELYDIADRLAKKRDEDDVAAFLDATGATLAAPTPFGVDDETWADIQASARNTAAALENDAESTAVEGELKALRNQLHQLV